MRWFLSPLSSEAALCAWDTAVTTVVTHSSGGDPALPALSWRLTALISPGHGHHPGVQC